MKVERPATSSCVTSAPAAVIVLPPPVKFLAFIVPVNVPVVPVIIPVAIIGAGEAKKKTDWKLKPGFITIYYGKPIEAKKYKDHTIDELSDYVRSELIKLIDEG